MVVYGTGQNIEYTGKDKELYIPEFKYDDEFEEKNLERDYMLPMFYMLYEGILNNQLGSEPRKNVSFFSNLLSKLNSTSRLSYKFDDDISQLNNALNVIDTLTPIICPIRIVNKEDNKIFIDSRFWTWRLFQHEINKGYVDCRRDYTCNFFNKYTEITAKNIRKIIDTYATKYNYYSSDQISYPYIMTNAILYKGGKNTSLMENLKKKYSEKSGYIPCGYMHSDYGSGEPLDRLNMTTISGHAICCVYLYNNGGYDVYFVNTGEGNQNHKGFGDNTTYPILIEHMTCEKLIELSTFLFILNTTCNIKPVSYYTILFDFIGKNNYTYSLYKQFTIIPQLAGSCAFYSLFESYRLMCHLKSVDVYDFVKEYIEESGVKAITGKMLYKIKNDKLLTNQEISIMEINKKMKYYEKYYGSDIYSELQNYYLKSMRLTQRFDVFPYGKTIKNIPLSQRYYYRINGISDTMTVYDALNIIHSFVDSNINVFSPFTYAKYGKETKSLLSMHMSRSYLMNMLCSLIKNIDRRELIPRRNNKKMSGHEVAKHINTMLGQIINLMSNIRSSLKPFGVVQHEKMYSGNVLIHILLACVVIHICETKKIFNNRDTLHKLDTKFTGDTQLYEMFVDNVFYPKDVRDVIKNSIKNKFKDYMYYFIQPNMITLAEANRIYTLKEVSKIKITELLPNLLKNNVMRSSKNITKNITKICILFGSKYVTKKSERKAPKINEYCEIDAELDEPMSSEQIKFNENGTEVFFLIKEKSNTNEKKEYYYSNALTKYSLSSTTNYESNCMLFEKKGTHFPNLILEYNETNVNLSMIYNYVMSIRHSPYEKFDIDFDSVYSSVYGYDTTNTMANSDFIYEGINCNRKTSIDEGTKNIIYPHNILEGMKKDLTEILNADLGTMVITFEKSKRVVEIYNLLIICLYLEMYDSVVGDEGISHIISILLSLVDDPEISTSKDTIIKMKIILGILNSNFELIIKEYIPQKLTSFEINVALEYLRIQSGKHSTNKYIDALNTYIGGADIPNSGNEYTVNAFIKYYNLNNEQKIKQWIKNSVRDISHDKYRFLHTYASTNVHHHVQDITVTQLNIKKDIPDFMKNCMTYNYSDELTPGRDVHRVLTKYKLPSKFPFKLFVNKNSTNSLELFCDGFEINSNGNERYYQVSNQTFANRKLIISDKYTMFLKDGKNYILFYLLDTDKPDESDNEYITTEDANNRTLLITKYNLETNKERITIYHEDNEYEVSNHNELTNIEAYWNYNINNVVFIKHHGKNQLLVLKDTCGKGDNKLWYGDFVNSKYNGKIISHISISHNFLYLENNDFDNLYNYFQSIIMHRRDDLILRFYNSFNIGTNDKKEEIETEKLNSPFNIFYSEGQLDKRKFDFLPNYFIPYSLCEDISNSISGNTIKLGKAPALSENDLININELKDKNANIKIIPYQNNKTVHEIYNAVFKNLYIRHNFRTQQSDIKQEYDNTKQKISNNPFNFILLSHDPEPFTDPNSYENDISLIDGKINVEKYISKMRYRYQFNNETFNGINIDELMKKLIIEKNEIISTIHKYIVEHKHLTLLNLLLNESPLFYSYIDVDNSIVMLNKLINLRNELLSSSRNINNIYDIENDIYRFYNKNFNEDILRNIPDYCPHQFILLELLSGHYLWHRQLNMINEIVEQYKQSSENPDFKLTIKQSLMGSGKSDMISPGIIMHFIYQFLKNMLNTKIHNCFLVMPEHLLNECEKRFLGGFLEIVGTQALHIVKKYNDSLLPNIRAVNNVQKMNIVIISDSIIKEIYLKPKITYDIVRNDIIDEIRDNSYFVFDEIDSMYNPLNSDFNIPKDNNSEKTLGPQYEIFNSNVSEALEIRNFFVNMAIIHYYVNRNIYIKMIGTYIKDHIRKGKEIQFNDFFSCVPSISNGKYNFKISEHLGGENKDLAGETFICSNRKLLSFLRTQITSRISRNIIKHTIEHPMAYDYSRYDYGYNVFKNITNTMIFNKDYGLPSNKSHENIFTAVPYSSSGNPISKSTFSEIDIILFTTISSYINSTQFCDYIINHVLDELYDILVLYDKVDDVQKLEQYIENLQPEIDTFYGDYTRKIYNSSIMEFIDYDDNEKNRTDKSIMDDRYYFSEYCRKLDLIPERKMLLSILSNNEMKKYLTLFVGKNFNDDIRQCLHNSLGKSTYYRILVLWICVIPKIKYSESVKNVSLMEIISSQTFAKYKCAFSGTVNMTLPFYDSDIRDRHVKNMLKYIRFPNRRNISNVEQRHIDDRNALFKNLLEHNCDDMSGMNFTKIENSYIDNGEITLAITGKKNIHTPFVIINSSIPQSEKCKELIKEIFDSKTKKFRYDVLIDVGAFLNEMSSEEFINELAKTSNVQGKIYIWIDKNDEKYVQTWKYGKLTSREKYHKREYSNAFVLFDNKHTVGIHIELKSRLNCLTTIDKFNRLTDVSQAIFRLRNINFGQNNNFVITQSIIKDDRTQVSSNFELYKFLWTAEIHYLFGSYEQKRMMQNLYFVVRSENVRDILSLENYNTPIYIPYKYLTQYVGINPFIGFMERDIEINELYGICSRTRPLIDYADTYSRSFVNNNVAPQTQRQQERQTQRITAIASLLPNYDSSIIGNDITNKISSFINNNVSGKTLKININMPDTSNKQIDIQNSPIFLSNTFFSPKWISQIYSGNDITKRSLAYQNINLGIIAERGGKTFILLNAHENTVIKNYAKQNNIFYRDNEYITAYNPKSLSHSSIDANTHLLCMFVLGTKLPFEEQKRVYEYCINNPKILALIILIACKLQIKYNEKANIINNFISMCGPFIIACAEDKLIHAQNIFSTYISKFKNNDYEEVRDMYGEP